MVNMITFLSPHPQNNYLFFYCHQMFAVDSGAQEGLQCMKAGTNAVCTAYLQNLISLTEMVFMALFFLNEI